MQVTVEAELDGRRLASVDAVDGIENVPTPGETHLYVVEFTAPAFPPSVAERANDLLSYDPEVTGHGVTISLVGPQAAIADVVGEFEAAGLAPDLLKLGPYEGRDGPLDVLTERQREVLCTAFEMGYFEVPRKTRAEDLAAELGVDVSTVVEHLQRAERNLLTEHLSSW